MWVADIAFAARWTEFIYVAFITDVFAVGRLAGQPILAYRYGARCNGTGIMGAAGNQGTNPIIETG
ncbi:hypothetical protein [Nitrosomonas sp. Nm58]|uniref:hypothetical protein n=1 Tax=Nitrosomonas sp. Nm58 TaxID=200126 RepID=UPI000B836945